jgi:hypothetical protein
MAKHDYRRRRNGCTQRYLPTDQVEDKVTDHDRNITLDPSRLGRFRQQVREHIEITRRIHTKEIDRRQPRLTKLRGERKKLLNALALLALGSHPPQLPGRT